MQQGGFGGPGGYGYGQPPGGGQPQAPQQGGQPGQAWGGMAQAPGMGGQPQQMMPGMGGQPQQMMPGMGGQPQNPYGQAQKALSGASGQVKLLQYGLAGFGGLLAVGGIIMIFVVGLGAGLGLAFTGVVMAVVAFTVLPQFTGMLGSATAQVDALAHKAQLAQTGVPAMGRLLHVQQTGRMVNYNPEVMAVVEVNHPQMGTYQVQTTAVVPQISIPQIQPGAQVQVRINPQNPQDIALAI